MKKILILAAVAASSALVGCNAMEEAAGKMVLGDQFVQANDKLNQCDFSGVPYLTQQAKSNDQLMASAAALALGASYAAGGDLDNAHKMAKLLAANSNGKLDMKAANVEILKGAKSTGKDRVKGGFSANCK
ncbi:hypothetical protein [Photobacterium damselae]|uniref:hypothetical protein n=1 Tax=Photobacterium damselae TaxID=38293 RepID=UPI001F40C9C9|nr:hypothetical protein [Photobacterium damselae]UKA12913.1 hypothetical protein IHC91_21585 [Photobacterium damselae subsp. damselae]